jgi:aspartyl-tRNA(Asn)/glutamyl-tRNA(Gln) amidotransferase subunit A
VGIPKEYMMDGMDPEVQASFNESVEAIKKLGAEVTQISLPHSKYALAAYYITAPAEASSNLARFDGIRYGHRSTEYSDLGELYSKSRAEGFGAEVKRRILMGSFVLSSGYYDAYYRKAQQVRTLIINDFKSAFTNKCDFILSPVTPTVAFKIGEKTTSSPLTMYLADIFTVPVNLAGLPAMTVPYKIGSTGLPISIQCIGSFFSEELLLGVAAVLEKEFQFPVHNKTTGILN